jgi:uncharacterized membrane protein
VNQPGHQPGDGPAHNLPADADAAALPVRTAPVALDIRLKWGAAVSLLALIALCVLWETVLAPLRPGGSWLWVKALPLLLPLRGVLRGNLYTLQWAAMMILIYFTEGVVRATSDPGGFSPWAWAEVVLTTTFFWCAVLYVRPAKQAARRRKAAASTR